MWNYQAFLSKLEDNFGPHDPVGDAEKSLDELQMKKSTHIVKYNVDFWELASRVDWNESALSNRYFHGLLLWLCTEVLCSGKPKTLAALHLKAQEADNIYWMQEEETHLESKYLAPIGSPNQKDCQKPFTPCTSFLASLQNPLLRITTIPHSTNSQGRIKRQAKEPNC